MDQKIFRELTAPDLQKYYGGCYMELRLPEKSVAWAAVREFVGATALQVRIRNMTGADELYKAKDIEWSFDIPESGVYNFKNTVVFFARAPIRHTCKGINNSNTIFANLLRPVLESGAIPKDFYMANDFVLNQENLQLLFSKPSPPSFEKGIERIVKKQALAYALDSRISLSQGIFSRHPSIWLKQRIIGELNLERKEAKPLHEAFIPELISSFTPNGIQVRQL